MRSPTFLCSLPLALLVAGCASTGPTGGGGTHDLGTSGGGADLAGTTPKDLAAATGSDLAQAAIDDLAMGGGMDGGGGGMDLAGADLTPPDDLVFVGKVPGESCDKDGDCQSMLCKATLAGSAQKICVSPCKAQPDCAMFFNSFCEAITAGSADGYCVPRSPAHCTSCAMDSDCGGLAERCIKAPGDIALACHVDCALAGTAACPPDYTCSMVPDGNAMRQLCVPKSGVCLDAIGGYCDRVNLPQPCARTNGAGSCTGQRACLQNSGRFDKCGAQAPQFKMTCQDMDPAGCMEQFSQAAISTKMNCGMCGKSCGQQEDCCNMACASLNTPQNCGACGKTCGKNEACCNGQCAAVADADNCGACGNKCPGVGQPGDEVACTDPQNMKCSFTCKGENYDVDNNPANGCEQNHGTTPGHTQGNATSLGSSVCDDSAMTTFSGTIMSDARSHLNPPLDGFDNGVGSAPEYWSIVGTGKSNFFTCVNNYGITITTSGGGNNPCYKLTLTTDKVTNNMIVSGSGSNTISTNSFTQYSSGSTLYFKIEKVCQLPTQEAVSYKVQFHL